MSTIKVDTITDTSGNSIPYMKGAVLQVFYTQLTAAADVSLSAGTATVLTNLTVNITPKSTSSIIKLDSHVFHEWGTVAHATESVWFFFRDTTLLRAPVAGSRISGISMSRLSHETDVGSTPEIAYYSYFDEPSTTSQITYKVGVQVIADSTLAINKSINDTDNSNHERGISFISATEIGG